MLLCSDITKKRDVLLRVCEPIMSRPPPKPEPAAPAADQPRAEGAGGDTEMKEEGGAAAPEAADTKMGNADDLD